MLSPWAQAQTTCYSCSITVDHLGKPYGAFGNDLGCDNDDLDQYEETCADDEVRGQNIFFLDVSKDTFKRLTG